MTATTKLALTPAQRRLLEVMQSVNFGRIENLAVVQGEPQCESPLQIVREIKFGGENGPRPEQSKSDFQLKNQVIDLFRELQRVGDGTVQVLEVKHGLPFRMMIAESVA